MVERDSEPLAATVLGDQRAVVIRPLGEEDQAALLAFGAALPADDLRYREDDFMDDVKRIVTNVRARLTLIGQKREGKFEDVLLSRSRYLAPASQSLRFYREYFKPKSEIAIEKDRLRWLIKYKEEEFFVNLDQMIEPELGYFLEIKSRTWSRKDAEHKAQLTTELLALLSASTGETVTEDYIDIVSEA